MPSFLVNVALLGLHLAPCPPKMALTMARTAVTMQVNDDGASREIMDEARDEAEVKADKATDAIGAAARAAIADTRVRAEAAVTALRAEIDAADGTHAVTKMLGKKGSLSPSGELAGALTKPPGTIAIIAQGAPVEAVSQGGFDLDDPVYLSSEFRRGNAVAVCVDVTPEQRLSAKAVKDTAQEQQTAMGEFPGPILVIARDDFVDEVQLAQVAADGATAVVLPLQLNGEEQTGALMAAAAALGLDTLVRVGDEAEVEAAVRLGASCVCFGDVGVCRADELRQLLPEGVICTHPALNSTCTPASDAAQWGAERPPYTWHARLHLHLHLHLHPAPTTPQLPTPTSSAPGGSQVISVSDCELRSDEAIRDTWRVRDLGFNAVILGTPACREWKALSCWRPSSPPQPPCGRLSRLLMDHWSGRPECAAQRGRLHGTATPAAHSGRRSLQCEAAVWP